MRHRVAQSDREAREKADLGFRLLEASGIFPMPARTLPPRLQPRMELEMIRAASEGNVRKVKGAIALGASSEAMREALRQAKEKAKENEERHKGCFYCERRAPFSNKLLAMQLGAYVSSPHVYIFHYEEIIKILSARLPQE